MNFLRGRKFRLKAKLELALRRHYPILEQGKKLRPSATISTARGENGFTIEDIRRQTEWYSDKETPRYRAYLRTSVEEQQE